MSIPSISSLSSGAPAPVLSHVTGLVLIVDDTPANLEVISETLGDVGIDVAIATSGDRALQQMERCLPDLILLDVMMPGIDGFETCRRIKANPRTSQIPVIFMTALSDPHSKVRALELGAVDYIAKPFHEQEVLARVRTHLQLHHLTQNLEKQVAQKTAELRSSQLQLIQSEKMSALGNLVAGVAHEINNPVGCIIGSVDMLQESIQDLFSIIDQYQTTFPEPGPELEAQQAAIDLDYLREDLPKLLQAMHNSGERIKSISRSLRTFSRSDNESKQWFNLHEGIDSTLLILRHRLKANQHHPTIEVIIDYGDIPEVYCFPGQLNQVFMNILANAIDALEALPSPTKGSEKAEITSEATKEKSRQIRICTALDSDNRQVKVTIADNGIGMTSEVRDRIFDHLFTTKVVGKGTGLGLTIAHQIVVEIHQGCLEVLSEVGQGTTFEISLPIGRE